MKDLTLHIAATAPAGLSADDIPAELVENEKDIFRTQLANEGKPAEMIDKIVEGKVDKYYSEICLLEQKYVKDPDMTVEDYLKSVIGALGENMQIKRFTRYQIGG